MDSMILVGADDVRRAGQQMMQAAQQMSDAAGRIEAAFYQRRQWEEEYLARIEAIVREELDFYKAKP